MSGDDDAASRQQVGYRNPPIASRFKAGTSGNPKGRPKRKKGFKSDAPDALAELFSTEAERKVTLNEGGSPTEMAAMRAVARSIFVDAIKGNRHARDKVLEIVASSINDQQRDASSAIRIALKYRADWLATFNECEQKDLEIPPILPHPRDVIIDLTALTVKFVGPCSTLEHTKYDKVREMRDEIGNHVLMLRRAVSENSRWTEDLARFAKKFAEIEELLPPSLQWRNDRPPKVASYFVV